MKPAEYRNRSPVEYLPNDFRLALKSARYRSRVHIPRRKRRKLPGVFVGATGIVILLAGELIKGTFGLALFAVGAILIAVGVHFELLNRLIRQYKYFIVPVTAVALFLVNWFWPQAFGPLLPRQYVTELSHFSSGFAFNSTKFTVTFGGGERMSMTYTKKQLEQAKNDSLSGSRAQIPFKAY